MCEVSHDTVGGSSVNEFKMVIGRMVYNGVYRFSYKTRRLATTLTIDLNLTFWKPRPLLFLSQKAVSEMYARIPC